MDINVLEFSPKRDGKTNDAIAVNRAVEKCSSLGGGRVIIPSGTYMCGSIKLLDNVSLYLEENARLKLSDNLEDFFNIDIPRDSSIDIPTWENCEYNGKPSKYFIYSTHSKNVKIEGKGIIDGNEEIFYGNVTKWHIEGSFYPRIPLIYFEDVSNFEIKDVTLYRSAFWTVHLVGSKDGLIDNLNIDNNLRMTNCDGIDPDHCSNIVIKNCTISSADDCIVLKCTDAFKKYGDTKNIEVYNCTLKSTSAAIKFGTESVNNFENIHFENIKIESSNRGISIQLRDEGNIKNISFKDITIDTRRFSPIHWWGKAEAIAITALKRNDKSQVGEVSNISFENIKTCGENGILIYGEKNISNVSFKDIRLAIEKKTDWKKEGIDLRPSVYSIIDGNPSVFYLRGATLVNIENCNYKIGNIDFNINKVDVKDTIINGDFNEVI